MDYEIIFIIFDNSLNVAFGDYARPAGGPPRSLRSPHTPRRNIRSHPVYFRSHHNPQGQCPVTSGQVPVPVNKPVIFKATSGLRPRMTSEVTEVNNLEVTE